MFVKGNGNEFQDRLRNAKSASCALEPNKREFISHKAENIISERHYFPLITREVVFQWCRIKLKISLYMGSMRINHTSGLNDSLTFPMQFGGPTTTA